MNFYFAFNGRERFKYVKRGKKYSKNYYLTIKGTVKFTVTTNFIVNDTVKINKIQYGQQ